MISLALAWVLINFIKKSPENKISIEIPIGMFLITGILDVIIIKIIFGT